MLTEAQVKQQLQVIVDNADLKALNWAVNYAQVALQMTGEELRIQLLYVRNNLSSWRGEEARHCKLTIDQYLKEQRKGS